MKDKSAKRRWLFILLGVLLSPLVVYVFYRWLALWALFVPVGIMIALVMVWPRLKAEAVPAKKTDFVGYAVIVLVLAVVGWVALSLI